MAVRSHKSVITMPGEERNDYCILLYNYDRYSMDLLRAAGCVRTEQLSALEAYAMTGSDAAL